MIKSSKWWEKTQRMSEGPKKAGGGGRGEVLKQEKEQKNEGKEREKWERGQKYNER